MTVHSWLHTSITKLVPFAGLYVLKETNPFLDAHEGSRGIFVPLWGQIVFIFDKFNK